MFGEIVVRSVVRSHMSHGRATYSSPPGPPSGSDS
jgi:hypothetical protein